MNIIRILKNSTINEVIKILLEKQSLRINYCIFVN